MADDWRKEIQNNINEINVWCNLFKLPTFTMSDKLKNTPAYKNRYTKYQKEIKRYKDFKIFLNSGEDVIDKNNYYLNTCEDFLKKIESGINKITRTRTEHISTTANYNSSDYMSNLNELENSLKRCKTKINEVIGILNNNIENRKKNQAENSAVKIEENFKTHSELKF